MNKLNNVVRPQRQSNVELLRIIAMIMVLAIHATFETFGYAHAKSILAAPSSWLGIMTSASACFGCVDIFILITGWFGTSFKLRGAFKLAAQVIFISLAMYPFLLLLGKDMPQNFYDFIEVIWGYWFIRCYLVLYLFTPVLNSYLQSVDEKTLRRFLVAFFVITIPFSFVSPDLSYGYSTLSFMGLYMLGRYLRLYLSARLMHINKYWFLLIWVTCVSSMSLIVWSSAFVSVSLLNHLMKVFTSYTNPITIFAACCLLLFFTRLSFQSKLINWLAAGSFAAYLTHQQLYVRPLYFELMRNINKQIASPILFFFAALATMLLIYLVSALLDAVRRFIIRL